MPSVTVREQTQTVGTIGRTSLVLRRAAPVAGYRVRLEGVS